MEFEGGTDSNMRISEEEIIEKINSSGLFDRDFYQETNSDIHPSIDPVVHYVRVGSSEGRRPNRFFDPLAYLAADPAIAIAGYEPLLHFILYGREEGRGRLFDLDSSMREEKPGIIRFLGDFDYQSYREKSGISDDVDPIEHYIEEGWKQGIAPNSWFDPAFYLARYEDVLDAKTEPYTHYIVCGRGEDRIASAGVCGRPKYLNEAIEEMVERGLFDERFYRKHLPLLSPLVDALEHYLVKGWQHHVRPSAAFDPIHYFCAYPEVRATGIAPPLEYILQGQARGRLPSSDFRIEWGGDGDLTDNDVHVERLRQAEFSYRFGIKDLRGEVKGADFAIGDLSLRRDAIANAANPDASIIIPVYGQLAAVLSCLDSLAAHPSRYSREVIIYDDASPDAGEIGMLAAIPWLRFVRGEQNRGFIGACNAAAQMALGKHIILLNSDTRICDGWLDELIGTFHIFPGAGLVGSKLYNEDGSLQEAGAIVWNDGSAWNYGRGDVPSRSQYSYSRQVDYCSGAAIAIATDLWKELGGFDSHFAPAYYEDVDLAFRVRAAGREVWLQPLAKVLHYEGITHGRDETVGVKAYQVVNAKKFYERWKATLRTYGKNGERPLEASDRGRPLMIAFDALTPTPDRDAGSVMTFKLLLIYQKLGWHVTFAAVDNGLYQRPYSSDLERHGVEVVCNWEGPEALLRQRSQNCSAVLAFRAPVIASRLGRFREICPAALMLFHDIDLHYLRMQREAELLEDPLLARQAELMMDDEFGLVRSVDCTIVPSTVERDILRDELNADNVVVYSYTADTVPNLRPFEERKHLVFVGGFRHRPNIDAVQWFVEEIWPRLLDDLPADAKFYVVGADAPNELLALASERVVFTGYLNDLGPTLEQCRVFVAPLRYGAGLKGKVVTSLSYGVPCVATSIAVEGMGLENGVELLIADNVEAMVAGVRQLYADPTVWASMVTAGQSFVAREYGWEAGMRVADEILTVAQSTWMERRQKERRRKFSAAASIAMDC
jgi:GT2 family glycosyltransferase